MNLVWLQSGGCGGCTMSLLCHDASDLMGMLADAGIRIVWHPSLSEATGRDALAILESAAEGRIQVDILCVEGALLRGPGGTGRFHVLSGTGRPMIDWVARLAGHARYVVAVGTCAAYGGVTAAGHNPTDACGLQYEGRERHGLLGPAWRSGAGLPVVNVAGCPTHPGWVVDTLIGLAMGVLGPDDLDAVGRPRFYADRLVHHGCDRNEYYEFKASAVKPSDLGCMMENMGCKGTQAHGDCNTRPWNGVGSCTVGGYACVRCTEPGFEEPGHPFAQTPKVAGIPIGLPTDMPKAWFVALAALSKSATPRRVRENAVADHVVVPPGQRTGKPK
jgi:uptake hydrogenase small subunit